MSSVRKTPADSAFHLLRYTITLYRDKNNGNLPANWKEFIESGVMTPQMITDTESLLDLEHRYKIHNPPLVVKHQSEEIKIIIMAMRTGGEGNRSSEDVNGIATEIPGRNLVFETVDGKISSGRFPESRLEKMFSDSGLSLFDYTYDATDMPKRAIINKPDDTSGLALGRSEEHFNSDSLTQGELRESPHIVGNETHRDKTARLWKWAFFLLIALFLGFLFKVKKWIG